MNDPKDTTLAYVNDTTVKEATVAAGNPIGLLLALTYATVNGMVFVQDTEPSSSYEQDPKPSTSY